MLNVSTKVVADHIRFATKKRHPYICEISYCTSCSGIIQSFNEMFPNIKLILIDGIK